MRYSKMSYIISDRQMKKLMKQGHAFWKEQHKKDMAYILDKTYYNPRQRLKRKLIIILAFLFVVLILFKEVLF
jgi:hypothetical protein